MWGARGTGFRGWTWLVPVAALAAVFLVTLGEPVVVAAMPTTTAPTAYIDPVENPDIRLEGLSAHVVCYRTFAEYRADYKFVNTGADQQVYLGFPGDPFAFRAWQDGRPIETYSGDIGALYSSSCAIFDLRFSPGETMLAFSYIAQPQIDSRFSDAASDVFRVPGYGAYYEYLLHCGSLWRGTIDKAVIRYELADNFTGWSVGGTVATAAEGADGAVLAGRPGSCREIDDRTYQWVLEDFDPTMLDDVVFAYLAPELDAITGWGFDTDPWDDYGTVATVVAASGWTDADGYGAGEPGNALDGDLLTGWKWKCDEEAWLEAGIKGDSHVEEVRILPGNYHEPRDFRRFGRPKSIKVELSDGTSTIITLDDQPILQRFPISGEAEWVRLEVLDSYPGSVYEDIASIAEIDLGSEPAPAMRTFSELVREERVEAFPPADPPDWSRSTPYVPGMHATPSGAPSPIGVFRNPDAGQPTPRTSDTGWWAAFWVLIGLIVALSLVVAGRMLASWLRSR